MPSRFTYSAWDGTQVGSEFDADVAFDELTDELLYHGDVNSARRRHRRPRAAGAPSIATRNPVKVAFMSGQKLWR